MNQVAKPRTFDLEERLILFSIMILEVVEAMPETRIGSHLAGQLLRSGTSPAPNYGEAQGAESRKDFVHKMQICLKELRETQIHLKVILGKQLIPRSAKTDAWLRECGELIAVFASSVKTAKRNAR